MDAQHTADKYWFYADESAFWQREGDTAHTEGDMARAAFCYGSARHYARKAQQERTAQ